MLLALGVQGSWTAVQLVCAWCVLPLVRTVADKKHETPMEAPVVAASIHPHPLLTGWGGLLAASQAHLVTGACVQLEHAALHSFFVTTASPCRAAT